MRESIQKYKFNKKSKKRRNSKIAVVKRCVICHKRMVKYHHLFCNTCYERKKEGGEEENVDPIYYAHDNQYTPLA